MIMAQTGYILEYLLLSQDQILLCCRVSWVSLILGYVLLRLYGLHLSTCLGPVLEYLYYFARIIFYTFHNIQHYPCPHAMYSIQLLFTYMCSPFSIVYLNVSSLFFQLTNWAVKMSSFSCPSVRHIKQRDGFFGCYRGLGPKLSSNVLSGLAFQHVTSLIPVEVSVTVKFYTSLLLLLAPT